MGLFRDDGIENLDQVSFEVSDTIDDRVDAALLRGLVANAVKQDAPPYSKTDLSITRCDQDGTLLAGLTGKTFWDWLYIDSLWVDEALRGQGVGAALVAAAEAEAIKRGCHSAYLWTESFEAPCFYIKQGYKEFVVMEEFPVGGYQHIGFMKKLGEAKGEEL